MHAAQLLCVSGIAFLDALPAMLEFWLHDTLNDGKCKHSDEELAYTLVESVSDTMPGLGNDIAIMKALPSVLREVSSVEENTLRMRYDQARRLLPADFDEADVTAGDISHVDQLLIPALLGGSIPLRASHAQEVKKHILRDDDVSATKLVAVYSLKNDVLFSARLPNGFVPADVIRRISVATSLQEGRMALFSAMKTMGCIGSAVFSSEEPSCNPRGFKVYSRASLALRYALAVDDELETQE